MNVILFDTLVVLAQFWRMQKMIHQYGTEQIQEELLDIINTCASVDHDCIISDYVHVSVGAHIAGTVQIGAHTWIGAGATVSNNISICSDCMIGAGTVVVRDIYVSGKYVGVPARKI